MSSSHDVSYWRDNELKLKLVIAREHSFNRNIAVMGFDLMCTSDVVVERRIRLSVLALRP